MMGYRQLRQYPFRYPVNEDVGKLPFTMVCSLCYNTQGACRDTELCRISGHIRKELNMSQTASAQKMHVCCSRVNCWESGHAIPNHLTTVALIDLRNRENTS